MKKDWKLKFVEAWGCKKIKDLDKGTQLSIEWIEENVVKVKDNEIKKLKDKIKSLKSESQEGYYETKVF
jgi:hypothetical protein